MYIDIKEVKTITARAYAAKIGSITMIPIINKIKAAAVNGKMEVCVDFKDYPMLNKNKDNASFLETWAKLCGYITARFDSCLYIKWY